MMLIERYKGMQESVGLSLVKRKEDFAESGNLVLGLEAGAHLITSMEDLRRLEDAGVKIFGFQYNAETPLASKDGLKPFGHEVSRYLFDHNLIIDLAHSGFQTRQVVMDLAEAQGKGALVSYTHGSSEADLAGEYKDRMGERALKKEEVERLIRLGGIIGLGVTQPFFANTRKLAERINEIAQINNGINSVALGTDFGGIMPEMLNEIRNPDDFKVLADLLSVDFGMSDVDVNKVLRSNAREWIQKAID